MFSRRRRFSIVTGKSLLLTCGAHSTRRCRIHNLRREVRQRMGEDLEGLDIKELRGLEQNMDEACTEHKKNNVLLGAPTGSGKIISVELAMLHLFKTELDMSLQAVYIAPLKALVREKMIDWRKWLVSQLGKKMVEMTGDFTLDIMALLSADIIISTPEKWDGISRSWHGRTYVMKVGLMILDEIHLIGTNHGPILEVRDLLHEYWFSVLDGTQEGAF